MHAELMPKLPESSTSSRRSHAFLTGDKPAERPTPMEAALIALALLWHSNSSEIDRRSTSVAGPARCAG